MKWLLWIIGSICGSVLLGQQVRFYADVNQTRVSKGQAFQVIYTLENADYSDFRSPDFGPFEVLSGPMLSNSVQIINGSRSSQKVWTYELLAKEIGTFPVPVASLKTPNGIIRSQDITVSVVKAPPIDQQVGDFALIVTIDTTEYYVREQIELTYKLLYRSQVQSYDILQEDQYVDMEAITLATPYSRSAEIVQGIRYNSTNIRKVLLYPQSEGEYTIQPMNIRLRVRKSKPGNFFGTSQYVNVSSIPISFRVNALPPSTDGFSVGRYELTPILSQSTIAMGDALTLRLQITTDANPGDMAYPELSVTELLEVYDPKTTRDEWVILNGQPKYLREYEYGMIPIGPGRGEIDVTTRYFDPDSARVIVHYNEPLQYQIQPSSISAGFALDEDTNEADTHQERNFRITGLRSTSFFVVEKWWYYALSAFALLPLGLGIARRQKLSQWNTLTESQKKRALAWRKVNEHFESLEKNMSNLDQSAFFESLGSSFESYLSNKMGLQASQFSVDKVKQQLKDRKIPEELITQVAQVYDQCTYHRYAPAAAGIDKEEWYQKVKTVVLNLESKISQIT